MRVYIGLGANLGDPAATFARAARELGRVGRLTRASGLYASAPRDLTDQPEFTNAVLELRSPMSPVELLGVCKRIELILGRDPHGVRFGPRVLDLDILAIVDRCVDDPEHDLRVPHPRLAERRFALEPLAEIEPMLRPWAACPEDHRSTLTVTDALAAITGQEVRRVAGPEWVTVGQAPASDR